MARALLDINVVIALLDQAHVLHRTAMRWLESEQAHGWATCPITQNGVVRIMAQPAYPNTQPAALVAERLAEACAHPSHAFWPEPISGCWAPARSPMPICWPWRFTTAVAS
jgi:predicted nucleic acid-binding protein